LQILKRLRLQISSMLQGSWHLGFRSLHRWCNRMWATSFLNRAIFFCKNIELKITTISQTRHVKREFRTYCTFPYPMRSFPLCETRIRITSNSESCLRSWDKKNQWKAQTGSCKVLLRVSNCIGQQNLTSYLGYGSGHIPCWTCEGCEVLSKLWTDTKLIRLKRIYNFWCSMLVLTPFA
jgi:hypothetical protein